MEFGTGWGRTRHILRSGTTTRVGICGASIDPMATPEEINRKPLCRLCAKLRHVNPCRHCGGTGMEPGSDG